MVKAFVIHEEQNSGYFKSIKFGSWQIRYSKESQTLSNWATDTSEDFLCLLIHDKIYLVINLHDKINVFMREHYDYPYNVLWVNDGFLIDFEFGIEFLTPKDLKIRYYNFNESRFEIHSVDGPNVKFLIQKEDGHSELIYINLDLLPCVNWDGQPQSFS